MREVFRIETVDGKGPYSYSGGDWQGFQCHMQAVFGLDHTTAWHPVAGWEESSQWNGRRWGFISMEQLRHWFDYFGEHGYDALRQNGFQIGTYLVPDDAVVEVDFQCVFDVNRASRVSVAAI